ncbi:MAG: enoyl-CoA hydratase/isomerase family protein [Deltaproteobacteria bacterium]|nr:enoyl-CoA hydratase/isomerase family protein [Deltaproteobacteria bacterium]
MGDYKEILYEKQRKGALITLNRPEAMNAISRTLIVELHQALDEAEGDPEVRAVILTGAGRAFSSGMDQGTSAGRRRDLHWPYGIPTGMSAAELIDSWRSDKRNFLRLWEFGKPIIGAINGWTMGAGSWLALFTHITIASEKAVFAQPEVRHGSNTSFMWTLLGGFKNALRYGLTGDHVDAYEALRIGLVVKVVPHDQLLEECFSLVERIALVPPETVKINLAVATMGLEMMGLRDAVLLDGQLSAPAHVMLREEFRRPLDEARFNEGIKKYLMLRDGPFQPEPFGPRSKTKQQGRN